VAENPVPEIKNKIENTFKQQRNIPRALLLSVKPLSMPAPLLPFQSSNIQRV